VLHDPLAVEAPAEEAEPGLQVAGAHDALPAEYLPATHWVQPSNALADPTLEEPKPALQLIGLQSFTAPPLENVPAAHATQPSSAAVAPDATVVADPAGHAICAHAFPVAYKVAPHGAQSPSTMLTPVAVPVTEPLGHAWD
jgi:hypothetical protein